MSKLRRPTLSLEAQGAIAAITVIVIGYVVTFVGYTFADALPRTPLQIGLSLLLGAVYLSLIIYEDRYFARFPSPTATAVYFIVQITLMLTIQLMLAGSVGIWLISMPLVGSAVTRLRSFWRWPVYLAALAGVYLPLGFVTGNWTEAFFNTLTFSPAVLFVVVFVTLLMHADEARQEAEQLAAQLEDANHRLSAYAAQVEELATTQERNRLAREIHDNLGHYLTVINVQIEAARAVMADNPDRALAALSKAQKSAQDGLAAVRQSVSALRESPIGQRPLPEAIATLLDQTESAGIVTEYNVNGRPRPLEAKTELTLYRVAQEGLTNVRKHARASRVTLTLDYSHNGGVRLAIDDNGVGCVGAEGGFGLLGLRERVHLLNGTVAVETGVGQGFRLLVTVPTELTGNSKQ